MGYRTVVMLSNDHAHEWANDPDLGHKIRAAMNFANHREVGYNRNSEVDNYGQVVECVHADTVTLAKLDFYQGFTPMAYTTWNNKDKDVDLLKEAAEKLGYLLVKKSTKN